MLCEVSMDFRSFLFCPRSSDTPPALHALRAPVPVATETKTRPEETYTEN